MIVWKWELNLIKYCLSSPELLSWAFTATTFIYESVLSVTEKLLSRAQVKDLYTEEYPCLDFAVFLANYPFILKHCAAYSGFSV